nr:MAG: putative coat protein [Leviviridae sp.]
MTISIPSSLTGTAQTGLTTPGYTLTQDSIDTNAKQSAVTALTGTQTGVTAHSVSSPFVLSVWKPKQMAVLGKPNPVTGLISNVPTNQYKVITVKGVTPQAGQPFKNMVIRTTIDVPAGADTADPANIRAALSAHFGLLSAQSAGIGDTTVNGLL